MGGFVIIKLLLFFILAALVFDIFINKKKLEKNSNSINEIRYWELKYNYKYIVSLFSIFIAITYFIGWNSYKDLTMDFSNKVNAEVDSVLNKKFKSDVDKLNSDIVTYKNKSEELSKRIINISEAINSVSSDYYNIYVVNTNYSKDCVYKFKDMKTIYGKKIPKFENAPIVIYSVNKGKFSNIQSGEFITDITTEYIEMLEGNETDAISFIIFEIPQNKK